MKIKRAIEILKKANHENDNFWWTDGEKQLSGDDIDNAITTILNLLDKEPYTTISKLAEENTILKSRTDEALNLKKKKKILPMTPQEFSRYEMKLRKTLKGEKDK